MMSSYQHPHDHSQEIGQMVKYQGFALFHVGELTHTIGLHSQQNPLPELLISGLSKHVRIAWMLDLCFQVKGPPSREALLDEARARRLPLYLIRALYPPGGAIFEPGSLYFLARGGLPGCFGVVEARYYEKYLWHACAHHESSEFTALQYVWSDQQGRFPWEQGYDQGRYPQQVLFDPLPLLPLSKRED